MADFVKVCPKMELSSLIAKLTFCSKIDFLNRRSLFLSCCYWRTWKAAKGQIRPRIDCGWFCQSLSKKSHLVPWLQNWLFESPISLSVLLSLKAATVEKRPRTDWLILSVCQKMESNSLVHCKAIPNVVFLTGKNRFHHLGPCNENREQQA